MNPNEIPQPVEVKNPLHTPQVGEQVVCEIKRHPIGIIAIYFAVGFVLFMLTLVIFAIIPALFSSVDQEKLNYYGTITLLVTACFGVGYAFISNVVYWGNRWVVTSDSITKVEQTGLFVKHAGQISLESLEDVTVEQNGFLTHILDYGVIRAESAGEKSKFIYLYCPRPNYYAKQILNARELFMLKEDNRSHAMQAQAITQQQSGPPIQPGTFQG